MYQSRVDTALTSNSFVVTYSRSAHEYQLLILSLELTNLLAQSGKTAAAKGKAPPPEPEEPKDIGDMRIFIYS